MSFFDLKGMIIQELYIHLLGVPTILKPSVRKLWPVRLAAILFIVLIILGNYWIFHAALGFESPAWLSNLSAGCIALLILLMPVIIFLNSREIVEEEE